MKVKDLVKRKTYKVFDYRSYTFFSQLGDSYVLSQHLDDTFIPAFYIGGDDRFHWFMGSDALLYCFSSDEIDRGDVRECD